MHVKHLDVMEIVTETLLPTWRKNVLPHAFLEIVLGVFFAASKPWKETVSQRMFDFETHFRLIIFQKLRRSTATVRRLTNRHLDGSKDPTHVRPGQAQSDSVCSAQTTPDAGTCNLL